MSTQVQPHNSTTTRLANGFEVVAVTPAGLREWRELERRIGSASMMCSVEWTTNWIKHFGNLVPHRIAVERQNGQAVGMTLLTNGVGQHDGPFPIRTLHFGTAGEPEQESVCVEYNRLLVSDAHRASFVKTLLQHIHDHERWECLFMDGMAVEDARSIVDQYGSLFSGSVANVEERPSHYCDLNAFRAAEQAGKEPWRMFGESTRTNLRRAFRDLGELTLDWSETLEQGLSYYDELIGYHQSRWQADGHPGVFSSRRFTEFHRDLITELLPERRLVLARARQGDNVLGILYVLIENNRLLYYQAGLPDHKSKLSLGCVTQYLTMLEGSRRGYDAFDFMAGDTVNKRVLSTHQNTLYWARWRRSSVKFKVLDGLRSLKKILGMWL